MVAGIFGDLNTQYVVSTALVSLYVSTAAVGISTLVTLPTALAIGFNDFRGKKALTTVINTGMGFPSVVVGLVVLLMLSNTGPFGTFGLLFTPKAMIISQFILATPVIMSVSLSAVESVSQQTRDAAFAAGGTSRDVGLVVIKEARYGIVTAVLAGYGRAISEVGSVLIVGGNIAFADGTSFTRTLTTAVTIEARQGRYETGIALGAVLLVLVLGVNAIGSRFRDQSSTRGTT